MAQSDRTITQGDEVVVDPRDSIHGTCAGCLAFVPEDRACPYCGQPSPHDEDCCPLCGEKPCRC